MGNAQGLCSSNSAAGEDKIEKCRSYQEQRPVLLVGLCGPSCSGKSTLSAKVAAKLNSPLRPIELDGYFMPSWMPSDAKWGRNWETPAGVDFESLFSDLVRVKKSLAEGSEVPPELKLRPNYCSGGGNLVKEGQGGKKLKTGEVVVVVVEGFLLFHDEAVSRLFDAKIWLETTCEVCCARRYDREAKGSAWGPFEEWYQEVVWSHYEMYRAGQLKNAKGALHLDAGDSLELLAERAVASAERRRKLLSK